MLKKIILNTGYCLMAVYGGLLTRRVCVAESKMDKKAAPASDLCFVKILNKGMALSDLSQKVFRQVWQKAGDYHVNATDADIVGIRFCGFNAGNQEMFVSFGRKIGQKPDCRHFSVEPRTQKWHPLPAQEYQCHLTNTLQTTENTLLICRTKDGHVTATTYQNKTCTDCLNLSVSYREQKPHLLDLQLMQKQYCQPTQVVPLFYDQHAQTGTVKKVQLPLQPLKRPIVSSRKSFSFRYQEWEYIR